MTFARSCALLVLSAAIASSCGDAAPRTPAEAQRTWVLRTLNDGEPSLETFASHFTPDYLASHPVQSLSDAFLRIHDKQAPIAFMGDDLPPTRTQLLSKAVDSQRHWLRIGLTTEDAPSGRMSDLTIAPNGDLDPALQTWPAVLGAVRALTPEVGFAAASLSPSGCTMLQESDSGRELAIGSNLKLYILAALGADIRAGRRAWTDTVAIRDDWKSLSPLELETAGTVHTLRDLAERMIAGSDNTAADHLLYTVGRAAVEAAVVDSGHASPARMLPFLSTWERFWLVLLATPAQQQAYVAADVAGRRAMLAAVPHGESDRDSANAALASYTTPRLRDEVGWFASPRDLCAVTARLMSLDAAFFVLLESHGLPDLRGDYAGLGYKAGSEPGVLSIDYAIARGGDGAWFFIGMILNDQTDAFDRDLAFYVLGAARGLLRH